MTKLVVSSKNSGCDLPFLVSRNWCRDLSSMSRSNSLCLYYICVSQPRFDVATSFLLSASLLLGCSFSFRLRHHSVVLSLSLLLGCNFSFRLRHHSVVLSLQAGRDSKLLVCLFSCRNVDIRSRPSSFFNHCNSCRDLKSMS